VTSRGFRFSRLQLERIFDAAADVHTNANHLVKCLLDLGLGVWGRLTEGQRLQVIEQTYVRYCDARIRRKLELSQREVELNARLGFALPAATKQSIRRLAEQTRTSMSQVAREKLTA
jgi:hypothetical protein